jgi:PPM family protein phosphatase
MARRLNVTLGNLSSIGRVRDGNEDYFGYFEPTDLDRLEKKGRIGVVADGMGGEAGGEVASRMAVEIVRETYFEDPSDDPTLALRGSLEKANWAIYEYAKTRPELDGMGTTCTALALRGHETYLAHVGDTRAYLIRKCSIARLTRDHSLGESGFANVLTRALGTSPAVDVDVLDAPLPLFSGDVFLLCSDGLWGLVPDAELLSVVLSRSDPQVACQALVALANERGGSDNITVQLMRIEQGAEPPGAARLTSSGLWAGLRRLLGAT